jgi:hypothetical protein
MVEPASMKPAAVKSAPVEPTKAAAVKSTTTAMEATTTASAMPSIGHLRLEYRAGTEQSSREATQSFSAPGPACIAANRFHRSLLSSAADRTSDEPNAAFIWSSVYVAAGPLRLIGSR